jgi:ketose-bisphosphate aldolase
MKLKDYFKKARKEKWAIGQFNFSTLEQLRAILSAAKEMHSPVILGASEGESNYFGLEEAVALVKISRKKYGVEVFLNLDHGKDIDVIKKAINFGYDAVHFDGSFLPIEENKEIAKKIVKYAKKKGVLVEGEIESIGAKSNVSLSDVRDFVKKTGVDSLAIAIGSKHACYENIVLDIEKLKEFSQLASFLVLHGGSGIPDDQVKKAIENGIVKININTELRMLWKKGIKEAIADEEIKPYKILEKIGGPIQRKVEEKIKIFGCLNKA